MGSIGFLFSKKSITIPHSPNLSLVKRLSVIERSQDARKIYSDLLFRWFKARLLGISTTLDDQQTIFFDMGSSNKTSN